MVTEQEIRKGLSDVFDPEIKMDIITLGLVYEIKVDAENNVNIRMTFTSMMCPYGPALVEEVKEKVIETGAKTVEVDVVFDPPWKPSEEVTTALGLT